MTFYFNFIGKARNIEKRLEAFSKEQYNEGLLPFKPVLMEVLKLQVSPDPEGPEIQITADGHQGTDYSNLQINMQTASFEVVK